jgi:sugar phosphate isomerase/epimerase
MKIGLNLYSIRNLIQTKQEFIETCKTLKEYGYSFLQYSGLPIHVDWIQEELETVGLPVNLTHVAIDRILNETDAVINEHKSFNCLNIGLGGVFGEGGRDFEVFKSTIDLLNEKAKIINDAGLKFFYHNHMHEFQTYQQGKTWYDYIIENAPYVNFTLDTYWVFRGGVDIFDVISKIKGRVDCVHFKDHKVILNPNGDNPSHVNIECACGDGTINFTKIYNALEDAGVKYVLVEQDNAATLPNTLEEVKKSIDYLNKIFN